MNSNSDLLVHDPVVQFGFLPAVPAVGRADEIAGDALEEVDVRAAAAGADAQSALTGLIAAIQAPGSVMVDAAVPHVVFVHEVDDAHDRLGVVRRISVHFHIEDVPTSG